MSSSFSIEKILFVFSLVVFSFLYGAGVGALEWFPHSFLDRALAQARVLMDRGLDAEPKVFDRQGAKTYRPGEMESGMTVVTSWWETKNGRKVGMKLIDQEGKILHEWLVKREDIFEDSGPYGPGDQGLHGSLLLSNGDIVFNQYSVGTARLNSCGEILWTLPEGSHHSIAQDEDGTFWITAVSPEKRTGSDRYPEGFPGLKSVWIDRILHVSTEGEILNEINALDILYENDLDRFLFQHRQTSGDVTHQNDVEPLDPSMSEEYPLFDAGDLLVSLRNINLAFVFNPNTKKVKWFSGDPFIRQHDSDFIGDGWVGIFDNNNRGRGGEGIGIGSWVRAFQPHTDSTRVLFQPDQVERFYTHIQGKWQHLKNGNMLLTESTAGRVMEVGPDGRIVWEWIHEPTDDGQVPSVTKGTRVDLSREEVASWPCSSVDSVATTQKQQTAQ
jgi:hypothetical protein